MLHQLIKHTTIITATGSLQRSVSGVAIDSRQVERDGLFIAIKGTQTDGHEYIKTAIERGATTIVYDDNNFILDNTNISENVTYLKVENSAKSAGEIAAAFYDFPSQKLKLVGITGTNGKTTTATLLYRLLRGMGYPTGLLSTVENKINDTTIAATHTTPDPIALNKLLNEMVEAGCEYAFMEVSSHALAQHRTAGVKFAGAIFTNISHDHLDYHKTFQEYIYAKKMLFDGLPKTAFALTNKDDRRGEVMLQNCKAKTYTYALRAAANYRAKIIANTLQGLHLDLDGYDFYGRLIGEFNAYNTLAIYATAILLQLKKEEFLPVLSNLVTAEGRFEYIRNEAKNTIGIVDYAHTPDALLNVLKTIAQLKGNGKVITVVGCGGDRDKTKRPVMAQIAADYSDRVVLTSDNPRTEDPLAILADMERGVSADRKTRVLTIENREQAIKTACALAQQNDIILVAGKGHEKYQDIKGVKLPFDDKVVLKKEL